MPAALAALAGLGVHWLTHIHRPMAEALESDMGGFSARAAQILHGPLDALIAFQSVGESLLLAALSLNGHWDSYVALTLVHVGAWLGGLLATKRLAESWSLGPAAVLFCVVVYATWLPSALYSNLCLNESVGASLVLIGAASWVTDRGREAFVGGVALGLACLFRPNVTPMIAILFALYICAGANARLRLGRDWTTAGRHLPFWVGCAIAVALGLLATRLVAPGSVGFAMSDAMNLYLGVKPIRGLTFANGGGWMPLVNNNLYTYIEFSDASMMDREHFFAAAAEQVRTHPTESLLRWGRNIVESTGYHIGYFPGLPGFNWLLRPFALASSLFAVIGMFAAWQQRQRVVGQLTLAAGLCMLVTVAFFMGTPRARFPFDMVFLVAAVAGARTVAQRWSSRRLDSGAARDVDLRTPPGPL